MSVDLKVCPECFGTGVIEVEETHLGIPLARPCRCVLARDIVRNLERGWRGLAGVPKIAETPLIKYTASDLYVTANEATFRSHLKYVGIVMGRNWAFQVSSDNDLMTAWLASKAIEGKEILDPDAASVSLEKFTLVDLVDPPDLLIIRLGVKLARNSAMPEVLMETLAHRAHRQKPTWVFDQPTHRFDPSHLAFSEAAAEALRKWDHVELDGATPGLQIDMVKSALTPTSGAGLTLSAVQGASNSGTHRVERETREPKQKRRFRGGGS